MLHVHGIRALVGLTGLVLSAAIGSSPANAQANCQWYGQTALKQQQENEKLKCGFKGPDWSVDLKAHSAWCGSVAPDVWKAAAQRRDTELSACAVKAKK
jgi:hypothetical protein